MPFAQEVPSQYENEGKKDEATKSETKSLDTEYRAAYKAII